MKRYLAPELKGDLAGQLLRGDVLPAGNYNLRARQAPSGNWELFVDGVAMRSGLTEAGVLRVAAHLRESFTVERFR